jgi:diguanylate cyclase (GGDEF)-like protein
MFDVSTNSLILVHHYGSKKDQESVVKLGEGIIGLAAENRMVVSQAVQHLRGIDDIEFAAPILFKERLIGVMGLSKIKISDGNEMRFISMIADLAGVSLQNCEFLGTAKEEAITDALTGLYNRRYFFEKAREAAHKAIKHHSPISIFIFDIDHFKKYNDMHGHPEGDYLLKELSRILKENSREGDVTARYGGEEFIVLMPDTDKEGAVVYGEKIRKVIESYPFRHREKQPLGYLSVSGGVASFPFDGSSIEAVIRCADEALYESKRSGRNMITRYEPFQFSTQ